MYKPGSRRKKTTESLLEMSFSNAIDFHSMQFVLRFCWVVLPSHTTNFIYVYRMLKVNFMFGMWSRAISTPSTLFAIFSVRRLLFLLRSLWTRKRLISRLRANHRASHNHTQANEPLFLKRVAFRSISPFHRQEKNCYIYCCCYCCFCAFFYFMEAATKRRKMKRKKTISIARVDVILNK